MERDIYLLYALRAFRGSMLFMPVIIPFFQANGLGMFRIMVLQATFSLVMLLCEIPSGYIADQWGRTQSLIAGTALGTVGIAIYAGSYSFIGFLIGEVVLGVGSSLTSGAYSAFLYDTLLQEGREDVYKVKEGMLTAWANYAEAGGSVIGGALASISLRTPFYVQVGILAMGIVIALLLREPERAKREESDHWQRLRDIVRYTLHGHAELKWLTLYTGFIGAGTLTAWWFSQAYYATVGVPVVFYGVTWAVMNGSVGVFSTNAHRYEDKVGRKTSLISLVVILALGYTLTAVFSSVYALIFLLCFAAVRGFNKPILRDYTNTLVDSDVRATVLSVQKLVGRVTFTVVGPGLGWVSDAYSLPVALGTGSVVFGTLGVLSLYFLHIHDAL